MTALFDPARHEPLAATSWNEPAARDAIARIVAETRAAASSSGTWPVHIQDGPAGSPRSMGLYFGSAGVVWALDQLVREGYAPAGETFAEHLPRHLVWNGKGHRKQGVQTRGYLLAEAGIRLAIYRTAPTAETPHALAGVIAENTNDPAQELMWGAPGTMLAALAMHRATGESRWADLFRAGAAALERTFIPDADLGGAAIWTQDLYDSRLRYYGLVHGFAGNAFVLIAGRHLLDPETWARWSPQLARTFEVTANREAGKAAWFAGVGPSRPGRVSLAQICHGSPGMVVGLADLPEPIDNLLTEGGELTWAAGPLAKGPGLCHGTAGNGYAFLKLHVRTGDPVWLDRARAFAMHAIAQSDAQLGGRRYSLWTGDLGLALYLVDCIEGRARFPTLDVG